MLINELLRMVEVESLFSFILILSTSNSLSLSLVLVLKDITKAISYKNE